MGYKVLYRKYRPSDFGSVVGQSYTVEMLKNAIVTGKNAHAYIFTGPRGTGKTSSAKIFAKALNCEHVIDGNPCNECSSCLGFKDNPDVIEIDAASNNGVDEIRELINNVKLVPTQSKYKVYIIDEVHMLTASAFNALLLTLEEPPSHVVFILATTDIQDVPITILSRCQRFDFKPIGNDFIVSRLRYVCDEEGIDISDDALAEIALISAGGMRDALGMLDQLANDDVPISVDMVSDYFGSVSIKKINELLTSIVDNRSNDVVNVLGCIKESGTNYAVFIEKLISELRRIAIDIKSGGNSDWFFEDVYGLIFDLNECLCNINISIDPYMLIEIVLLKYVRCDSEADLGNKSAYNRQCVVGNNKSDEKYFLGNNVVENVDVGVVGNKLDENVDVEPTLEVEKCKVNLDIRINNCFVNASKGQKQLVSESWVDFMNFLMNKNRNLVSLLADTVVLTASDSYVLIQSKIESTNDLINESIGILEGFYSSFSGSSYKFAAINVDLWKKETEKYRFNLKNKIKYSYVAEDVVADCSLVDECVEELGDMESVAKDIFGTYEVQ